MVVKSLSHILSCLLFGSLISNSNQFNLENFLNRRSFLKTTISSLGLINLNAKNLYLDEDNEDTNLVFYIAPKIEE